MVDMDMVDMMEMDMVDMDLEDIDMVDMDMVDMEAVNFHYWVQHAKCTWSSFDCRRMVGRRSREGGRVA